MPGEHSPHKEPLCVQISRKLHYQLRKKARMKGIFLSELIRDILQKEVTDIQLTDEDEQYINEATKRAKRTGRRIATEYH